MPDLGKMSLIELEEIAAKLRRAIARNPEQSRMEQVELEDVKQAEIAKIVGLSETNIRVKVYRIKERLAKKFENYER